MKNNVDEIKIANKNQCQETGAPKSKRGLLMLNGKGKQRNQWYWAK
jgi:hypothetical protein